jgi:hypothetical protein
MHVPSQPFGVIAAFAAPNPTTPCGGVGLRLLSKLPCQANHSAYFRSAKFYLSRTFSAIDGSQTKQLLQNCQCHFSVQNPKFKSTPARRAAH